MGCISFPRGGVENGWRNMGLSPAPTGGSGGAPWGSRMVRAEARRDWELHPVGLTLLQPLAGRQLSSLLASVSPLVK